MLDDTFHVYDTTLRDGAQQEGLNLSVADKLVIARQLDELGVGFIEGGWPGAIPKDTEFFRRAATELDLKHAQLAAFGATRRPGVKAADDPQVAALRESGAPVVTLVAKSHDRHVLLALRTTLEENLAMIADTVSHLRENGQRVFLDAEHFFDGYRSNPDYALEVVSTAMQAGADLVALCDTNGGMMPNELGDVVTAVRGRTQARLGIHCHDDTACGVANTLVAVDAGVTHVQGTANGYGERAGNANLFSVVAGLQLKKGRQVLPETGLAEMSRIAHQISEVTNVAPDTHQPYVGLSAFAHKAGLHASRDQGRPDAVPAHRPRAGRQRHADAGLGHGGPRVGGAEGPRARLRPVRRQGDHRPGHRPGQGHGGPRLHVRGRRRQLRAAAPRRARPAARVLRGGVLAGHRGAPPGRPDDQRGHRRLEAKGERLVAVGEGNGPVNALDKALRAALEQIYPELAALELTDYKVRILAGTHGTGAVTRVLIESDDGTGDSWSTVGVDENIIAASWHALEEAVTYCLLRSGREPS